MALQGLQADPIFGRPTWTYINVQRGPVMGPQPRLSIGSGNTGGSGTPGANASLPGYVSQPAYKPTLFEYANTDKENFLFRPPRTINIGDNGRILVGTYEPHDITIGQRFFHQMRSAPAWQEMAFKPDFRQLLI